MDQQRVREQIRQTKLEGAFGCLDAGVNETRLVKFIEGFLPLGFSKLSEMLESLNIRAHKNRLFKTRFCIDLIANNKFSCIYRSLNEKIHEPTHQTTEGLRATNNIAHEKHFMFDSFLLVATNVSCIFR